jgi:hypothetical protein
MWDQRQNILSFLIIFRFVMSGALSDERLSLVYSCCWASLAQSVSGPSPAGLMTIFLFSHISGCPNLEGHVSVFIISLRNRVVQ